MNLINELKPLLNTFKASGKCDNGKRWYPSQSYKCCTTRAPSRNYPWSLFKHCLTYKHRFEMLKYESELINKINVLKKMGFINYTKEEIAELIFKKLGGQNVE